MRPIVNRYIVLLDDPDNARLENQVAALGGIYRRRVLPTLTLSASILGAVVVVSQIANWIAR